MKSRRYGKDLQALQKQDMDRAQNFIEAFFGICYCQPYIAQTVHIERQRGTQYKSRQVWVLVFWALL